MFRISKLAALGALVLSSHCLAESQLPILQGYDAAAGTVRIAPDGSGQRLDALGLTVSVTLVDEDGNPIAGYAFQDIQLVDSVGGTELSLCGGGWVSDANTNAAGQTIFRSSPFGGGHSSAGLRVQLAGTVQMGFPVIDLHVVSSDLDGDLLVNMLDVAAFAIRYTSQTNDPVIDLNVDGVVNLLDVGQFAMDLGAHCP